MHGMKVRYEIHDMSLKVSNVNLGPEKNSYVLLTASDERNNEVLLEMSHEQAELLADEFYMANRRRKELASSRPTPNSENRVRESEDMYNGDVFPS